MTLKEWILAIPEIRDEAKALWGGGKQKVTMTYRGEPIGEFLSQYHLKKLIESDDPIAYYNELRKKLDK